MDLKGQSCGYFLYFCLNFAKFVLKYCAQAQIAFKLLTKEIKSNEFFLKKKLEPNQFLPILPEAQEQKPQQNLPEDFKLEPMSVLAICNLTHFIIKISFCTIELPF